MAEEHNQAGGPATADQPSEQEMRAAYEAELNRITSSEMILQTAVSLLNIGGRRLGLTPAPAPGTPAPAAGERDLEQVRDAIDGVSALMPILQRRMPGELGPLRDAIAQLQVAYARESSAGTDSSRAPQAAQTSSTASPSTPPKEGAATPTADQGSPQAQPTQDSDKPAPGPAQASGRLWVPGR